MKQILLLLGFILLANTAPAQHTKVLTEKDYANTPVWINMIKDTSVNFFEAEKAFNAYFKNREKPEEEHDVIGERDKKRKHPSKRLQRRMQAENKMRMEVKKYNHWRDMMLPFVQPDGHILTPAERLKIWEDQKSKK